MDAAPFDIPADLIYVVDADSIHFDGDKIRLLGFDAPEMGHAKCPAERRLAIIATARLQQLIDQDRNVLAPTGRRDKYGRVLAVLQVDGRDVAQILIAEGHAVAYNGRGAKRDWCR
jgi:micrococcal nuclease